MIVAAWVELAVVATFDAVTAASTVGHVEAPAPAAITEVVVASADVDAAVTVTVQVKAWSAAVLSDPAVPEVVYT